MLHQDDLQNCLMDLYAFTAIKQPLQISLFFSLLLLIVPFGFDVIYLKTNLIRHNGCIRLEELLYLICPSVALVRGLGTILYDKHCQRGSLNFSINLLIR